MPGFSKDWKSRVFCRTGCPTVRYISSMKQKFNYWKPISVGLLLLGLIMATRCHWVGIPLRRADAVIEMKTTGYCSCKKCCSWKRTWYGKPIFASGSLEGKYKKVGMTASGHQARPGTIAVDRKKYPMGTKFYIPGYGWGIAQDTGGAIKGEHLDLFFWWHKSGLKWGVQTKPVKVWYPRD